MDLARYSVHQICEQRQLSAAYHVTELARNKLLVSWQMVAAGATEQYQVWSKTYEEVVGKLKVVQSAYVAPLQDSYVEPDAVHMVFPYYEAAQHLGDRIGNVGKLVEQEVLHMLHDLLRALRDLHAHGLYMGVLQAKSVSRVELLEEGYRYILTDPGVTRVSLALRPEGYDDFVERNAAFCAPEGMYDLVLHETADVYLCAQLAYYALMGGHPLLGKSLDEVREFYTAHKGLDCGTVALPGVSGELAVWLEKHLLFLPNHRETSLEQAIATLPRATEARVAQSAAAPVQQAVPTQIPPPQTTTMMQPAQPVGAGMGHVPPPQTTTLMAPAQPQQQAMAGHVPPPQTTTLMAAAPQAGGLQAGQMAPPPRTTTVLQGGAQGLGGGVGVGVGAPGGYGGGGQVLASAQVGGNGKLWLLVIGGLVAAGAIVGFIVWDSKKPRAVVVEDDEPKVEEPKGDVMDPITGNFNLSKWEKHVKVHQPSHVSIEPVIERKAKLINVPGSAQMSYEFIAYSPSSVGGSTLMGARGDGTCNVAIKFEQYPGTKKFGVTWFGVKDAPFADAPTTFDKVVHLVYVFNGSTVVFYEDGVLKGEIDGKDVVKGEKVAIGGGYRASEGKINEWFAGDIFGYAIYPKALSAHEVATHYSEARKAK